MVTALQPLLTGALSKRVLGEPTNISQFIGLLLGFVGVCVSVGARLQINKEVSFFYYLLPFISVLGMTAATLIERKRSMIAKTNNKDNLSLDTTLFYQALATTLALAFPAWVFEGFQTNWTFKFSVTMAWLVIPVSLGAYIALWKLLRREEATRVASLFYFSPPVTMLMAWFILGDSILTTDTIALVVAGAGVFLIYKNKE